MQEVHPSSIPKKKKLVDENGCRGSFKLFDEIKKDKKNKSIEENY